MHRELYGFSINYDDLINMMDYERFEIPISEKDVKKVMNEESKEKFYKNVNSISGFLYPKHDNLRGLVNNYTPIVFGCINKKWTFRFSPERYFNNLLILSGFSNLINTEYYELDNETERNYYKEKTLSNIKYAKENINMNNMDDKLKNIYKKYGITENDFKRLFNNAIYKFDEIIDAGKIDLGEFFRGKICVKDLMCILSIKSLNILEATENLDYGIMPYLYYKTVSEHENVEYPHRVNVGGITYEYDYSDFNNRIENLLNNNPVLLKKGIDRYNGVYDLGIEVVPSGESLGVRRDTIKKLVYHNADARLIKQFELKLDFFSKYNHKLELAGLDKLSGYYGYVLDNDFVVFDKVTVKCPERTKHPIYGNAIYRMPADKLEITKLTKKEIYEYIKENPDSHVKRIMHDENNHYMDKLNALQDYPNYSTKTIEQVLDDYKVLNLVK